MGETKVYTRRVLAGLKNRARALKREVLALSFAYRHPRTPWVAKLVAAGVVAYALSPIDLIPDFIPVLGFLDDLILLPAGIALALRLIPAPVMAESRERAAGAKKSRSWVGAGIIFAVWLLALWLVWRVLRSL